MPLMTPLCALLALCSHPALSPVATLATLAAAPQAAPAAPAAPVAPAATPPAGTRPPIPAGSPQMARIPLEISPPLVDFGIVGPGTKHPAKFLLRNVGREPLVVARAVPSCKCTDISDIAGKTIPPGGTLELTAALLVPKSPGMKDAKVMIAFEGFNGMMEAKMQGDVTMPVRVAPAYVDALRNSTQGKITLSSVDGKPFRILSAGGHPPVIEGFDAAKDAPRAQYELQWRIADIMIGDALPQWWVVETDRDDCPLVPLRVRHETTASRFDMPRLQRFWFPPESVLLAGRVKAGTPVDVTTTIEHLNPSAQGRVTNPAWSDVKGARVPGGEGTIEIVSATKRGEDFVDLVLRFTPKQGLVGAHYIPVELETASGKGPLFVSVTVTP